MVSLDDLNQLQDDIFEGAVAPPEEYLDQTDPAPPGPGKYEFKITNWEFDKDRTTGSIRNPSAPTFVLDLEVIGGPEGVRPGRTIRFIRVSSKSFVRKDNRRASALGDLIRGLDDTYNWQNSIRNAGMFLNRAVDTGMTFKARGDWKAWDGAYFDQNRGAELERGSVDHKALMNACSIQGARRFEKDGTVVGPSGETLTAQFYLARIFPSSAK